MVHISLNHFTLPFFCNKVIKVKRIELIQFTIGVPIMVLRSQHRVYDGRGEVARTQDVWGAEGISGRVKFLLLAWAGMPMDG
jgi:hypothetical protein